MRISIRVLVPVRVLFGVMAAKNRFANTTAEDINALRTASVAKNTNLSTNTWINVFSKWAEVQDPPVPPIEQNDPEQLNMHIEKFYA